MRERAVLDMNIEPHRIVYLILTDETGLYLAEESETGEA